MRATLSLPLVIWTGIIASDLAVAHEYQQCSVELQAAESTVGFRDQGRPKRFLTDLLPPRPGTPGAETPRRHPTLTAQMYSIIDDVYANPGIKLRAYLEYRNRSCINRAERIKVPAALSDVSLPVFRCQEKFGNARTPQLTRCIRDIFENYQRDR